jgi:pimeloyl-ACP methyl ester carboxylesterase
MKMLRFLILLSLYFFTAQVTSAQQAEDLPSTAGDIGTTLLDSKAGHKDPSLELNETLSSENRFERDTYRLDPVICPFKGTIEYEPGDFDCFLLEVPENREKPDSRFIELHVVRINSRWGKEKFEDKTEESGLTPGKREDPVIYLTGGPGAQATTYVRRLRDHGILDHRDLYILEQRGIGYSDDFCPLYSSRKPAADEADTFEESLAAGNERVRFCAENATAAGVDLSGYNTIENARDVKALRRALGFEKWNVWGISYGSILGQAYIREDPEGILAVALDAIMPLEIRGSDEYWRVVKWYMRDLEKLQEICDAQPDCAQRYPDLIGRLRQAVESVVDNPIEVKAFDTEVFPSGEVRIFENIAAMLPFAFLYEQKNYPALPGMIYAWADAVESRDEDVFQALVQMMSSGGFFTSSQGMANAIHCTDGGRLAQTLANQRDREEFPVLGRAMGTAESNEQGLSLCSELGMTTRPEHHYEAIVTELPSLIIEGDMDPITPPPNAKAILPGFSNVTYVEFPYAGHGPSRSVECGGDMLNAFFDDPQAEPNLECVEEMEVPDMIAPVFLSSAVTRLAALAAKDKKKLAVPGAWLGVPVLILLTAFIVLSSAPLMRWFDGRSALPAGSARTMAWLTATVSVAAVAILGAAIAAASEVSEVLVLFGFMPWAAWGAWAGLVAGLLGLLTIVGTARARTRYELAGSRVIGFTLTGLAAVALSAFLLFWDLGPF